MSETKRPDQCGDKPQPATPRTDLAVEIVKRANVGEMFECVKADFARQLERELVETHEAWDETSAALNVEVERRITQSAAAPINAGPQEPGSSANAMPAGATSERPATVQRAERVTAPAVSAPIEALLAKYDEALLACHDDQLSRAGAREADKAYVEARREFIAAISPRSSEAPMRPRSTYEPLTQEDIDVMAKCLLNQHELYPLTPDRIRRLCAMAGNALLYGEEIQRLRDGPQSARKASDAIHGAELAATCGYACTVDDPDLCDFPTCQCPKVATPAPRGERG